MVPGTTLHIRERGSEAAILLGNERSSNGLNQATGIRRLERIRYGNEKDGGAGGDINSKTRPTDADC